MSTPRAEAARANPQATASCRAVPPRRCSAAPTTGKRMSGEMLRIGQKAFASAGVSHSLSTPGEAVGVDVALDDLNVVDVVGEHHHPARRIHDVVIQLARQAFPELQRMLVERRRFLPEVVRAQDRGVAAGVAAAEPALLQHGDSAHAVVFGEIIGGREPVPARPDDDDVVRRLRLGARPLFRPPLVPREPLPHDVENRKTHRSAASSIRSRRGLPVSGPNCEDNFVIAAVGDAFCPMHTRNRNTAAGSPPFPMR